MRTLLSFLTLSLCLSAQTAVFPGAVATDAQLMKSANSLQTNLSTTISSSATSFTVASASRITANMLLAINSEIMMVCSVVGSTVSIGKTSCPNVDGRGFDGTTASSHAQNATVSFFIFAWHHNSAAAEIKAIQTALGVNLANVLQKSGTPTLSNCVRWGSGNLLTDAGAPCGLGTVASVGLSVPSWLSVTGSPVTTNGTLAIAAATGQTANRFLATPDGSSGTVGLRAIAAGDLPATAVQVTDSHVEGNCVEWGAGSLVVDTAGPCIEGSGTVGKIVKFTGSSDIGNAAAADVVALFTSCTGTKALAADGTCVNAVTSVGLSVPAFLSVSGSPVTSSGTLAVSLATQAANIVFAGPTSGGAATPTFRSLVSADIPNNAANTSGTAAGITGYTFSGAATVIATASGALTNGHCVAVGPGGDFVDAGDACGTSGGGGTVASVGLSLPAIFSVSGSPVTTTGTLTAALATQTANRVWAGPTTGSAAAPTFRALVSADIPNNAADTTGNAATATELVATPSLCAAGSFARGVLTSANATGCTVAATGTVTSVGLTLPSIFSVSGSPVTGSGTLAGSLANQNANLIFAGPASGSATTPTFRSMVVADIPSGYAYGSLSGAPTLYNQQVQTNTSNVTQRANLNFDSSFTLSDSASRTTVSLAPTPTTVYASADYAWSQTPSGSVSAGSNTVTLSPCPRGVAGANTNHKIYLTGPGSPTSIAISKVDPGSTPFAVTTTSAHGFATGQFVNILCPSSVSSVCGPWVITVTGSTTFTLNNSVPPHPFAISNATNASPIVVDWNQRPGLATGDSVTISGVTGNTAANGTFTYTKINDYQGSLNSSTGNGAFTGGTQTITFGASSPSLGGTATVSMGPESALITGGTCTSGAGTGTIIFTAKQAHSAGYSIQSATAGLAEMINVAAAAGVNAGLVPSGVSTMQDGVVLPSGFTLAGAADMSSILRLASSPGAADITMLYSIGSATASTTTTTTSAFATRKTALVPSLTLASASGFAAGGYYAMDGVPEGTYGNTFSQMGIIKSVSGSVISLQSPIIVPIITASSVYALSLSRATIRNLTLDGNSVGADRGYQYDIYGIYLRISQANVSHVRLLNFTGSSGLLTTYAINSQFQNIYLENSGSASYGDINIRNCTQCDLSNVISERAFGFGPFNQTSVKNTFSNITVNAPFSRGLKLADVAWGSYSNISVHGSIHANGVAITNGSFNNNLSNIVSEGNNGSEGIWFSAQDNQYNTISGLIARNNTYYGGASNTGYDILLGSSDHDNRISNYQATTVYDLGTANTLSPWEPARSMATKAGAAQSIPNSTYTSILFDTNIYDVGSVHSTSVNTSRFTIPTGQGGTTGGACAVWRAAATVSLASTSGIQGIRFLKNGATITGYTAQNSVGGGAGGMPISAEVQMCDADYLEVQVIQTSGGAVDTSIGMFMTLSRAY